MIETNTTSHRWRCINKFKPRKSEQQYRISRVIGKHWSIIVWSSIKQTTIVRNEKRRKKKKDIERYSTRFYSGRSFPLYALATHTFERIQMKFAFQMDSPSPRPYGTRIKYISHECTLQDYHSSYEMEFQLYIYIYRNKSLAPFMTFLHRSIDRLYRASIYRESHPLTYRMKRHIPREWYYVALEMKAVGENLLFDRFLRESNKTNFLTGWK